MMNPYKKLRLTLGYTQEEMAGELGIVRTRIVQLEQGKGAPGGPVILRIDRLWGKAIKKLGLKLEDFLNGK